MKLIETRLDVLFRDYKETDEEPLKILVVDAIIDAWVAMHIHSEFTEATCNKIGEMRRKFNEVESIVDGAISLRELSKHVISASQAVEDHDSLPNTVCNLSDTSSEAAEAIANMGRLEAEAIQNTMDTVERSYRRLMRGDDMQHSLASIDTLGTIAQPIYGFIKGLIDNCKRRVRDIRATNRKMKQIREFRVAAEHWSIIATEIGRLLSEKHHCNTSGLSPREHVCRTRSEIVHRIQFSVERPLR
jgi:hypothetical protein